jgi:hypothetical protein
MFDKKGKKCLVLMMGATFQFLNFKDGKHHWNCY